MGFTESEEDTINLLVTVGSVISFFGSVFIIFTVTYFEDLNKFAFKLVRNVAISDLIFEVSFWFTSPDSTGGVCDFSGWLQQFGTLSSAAWITLISFVILQVSRNPHQRDITENLIWFHGVIWGTSFLAAILPLFSESYGPSGGWCWIVDDDAIDVIWRFVVFYVPVWMCIFYIIYVYYLLSQQLGTGTDTIKRMRLYPAILVFSWFFGTVNRVVELSGTESYELTCTQAFFMGLYGFMNAMAYLYSPKVQETVFGFVFMGESDEGTAIRGPGVASNKSSPPKPSRIPGVDKVDSHDDSLDGTPVTFESDPRFDSESNFGQRESDLDGTNANYIMETESDLRKSDIGYTTGSSEVQIQMEQPTHDL